MNPAVPFAAAAAAVHISAYAVYSRQMLAGHSRPNMATWVLWVFLSALNCSSYLIMSGDLSKAAVAFAGAAACTATFIYSLKKGKVSRLGAWDTVALAVGVLAAGVWWGWRSATYANLILQFGFFISFLPTYRGLLKDPTAERPLPWLMWGLAYSLNVFVVTLRWQGHAADMAYPLLSLFTHTGVGLLAAALARRRSLVPVAVLAD